MFKSLRHTPDPDQILRVLQEPESYMPTAMISQTPNPGRNQIPEQSKTFDPVTLIRQTPDLVAP